MRTHFKLRSTLLGEHIHTTIFSGPEGQTLAYTGVLIQTIGEWGLFGALLKCGSELNQMTTRDSYVSFEGDTKIIEQLEKEGK